MHSGIDLQRLAAEWVVGCLVAGMALPLLSITLVAAIDPTITARSAIGHGELFLSAANAIVAATVSVLASGNPRALLVGIIALLLLAVPAYVLWASLAIRSINDVSFDESIALRTGSVFVVVAALSSFGLCLMAHQE